jgi:hypothetical protein
MPALALHCHPATPCPVVGRFDVGIERPTRSELRLRYRIHGDTALLSIPRLAQPERCDDLWRHTCLEAFINTIGQKEYLEFNFAPSTAWALYHFSAYRNGMTAPPIQIPPSIVPRMNRHSFELDVRLDLNALAFDGETLRLALAAVIESRDGELSYWALHHAPGRPDFHHPEGYVLELDPP